MLIFYFSKKKVSHRSRNIQNSKTENGKRKTENGKRKTENGKWKTEDTCTVGEKEETATLVPPTLKLLYNRGSAAACTLQHRCTPLHTQTVHRTPLLTHSES